MSWGVCDVCLFSGSLLLNDVRTVCPHRKNERRHFSTDSFGRGLLCTLYSTVARAFISLYDCPTRERTRERGPTHFFCSNQEREET